MCDSWRRNLWALSTSVARIFLQGGTLGKRKAQCETSPPTQPHSKTLKDYKVPVLKYTYTCDNETKTCLGFNLNYC